MGGGGPHHKRGGDPLRVCRRVCREEVPGAPLTTTTTTTTKHPSVVHAFRNQLCGRRDALCVCRPGSRQDIPGRWVQSIPRAARTSGCIHQILRLPQTGARSPMCILQASVRGMPESLCWNIPCCHAHCACSESTFWRLSRPLTSLFATCAWPHCIVGGAAGCGWGAGGLPRIPPGADPGVGVRL